MWKEEERREERQEAGPLSLATTADALRMTGTRCAIAACAHGRCRSA